MEALNRPAEYAAFVVMFGLSTIVGLYFGCVRGGQNTINEYLLGGKQMSVFPIAMSLVASHVTGITLLGVPAEIYSYGTQYLVVALSNIIAIVIVIYIYLPVFYELQLISVFEYLERRFNYKLRALISLIFTASIILYLSAVIYTPTLAFEQVTGINLHFITPIIYAICIFYTTFGGFKAVVWTDVIQSIFTAVSLLVIIVLGLMQVGGFGNVITANQEGGRIEFFKMNPDPFMRNTFWTVSIGLSFLYSTHLGLHPGTIQRCMALPTYKMAKRSMIYFAFGMATVKILTGIIGMLMYTKYGDCNHNFANYIDNGKNLVPYFVVDVASKYPGITGLFVCGIVSSALSTLSAHLNTTSCIIYEDFIVKLLGSKVSDSTASLFTKCTVVVTGILSVALVMTVNQMKGVLQIALGLIGIVVGPMLSVFTLGVCFPWANSRGAMCGTLFSMGVMTWIISGAHLALSNNEMKYVVKSFSVVGCQNSQNYTNHFNTSGLYQMNDDVYASPNVWKMFTVSYMYFCTIGTLVGIAVGLVVSLLFPTDEEIDPKLLTPCIRRFINPKYLIKKNVNRSITEENELIFHNSQL